MINPMKVIKVELYTMLPLALAPFTFLVFAPIEMIIRNSMALWFTWYDVIKILLVVFVTCVIVLCIIGLLLTEKLRRYYVAMIWGLGMALYIQGNLMPVDYGILDGRSVAWEEFTIWAIVNTATWLVLLGMPVVAVRFRREITHKIMLYATCVVLFAQTGTTLFLITQQSPRRGVQLIATTDYLYTVSENKNIVILILDSFDTIFMHELLEEEPELAELLDGFVFFDNTLGMFPKTMGALPHILTGMPYLNEQPFWDYLDYAFATAPIYSTLYEEDFSIFLHVDTTFISRNFVNYIDNVHEVEWVIDNPAGMFASLLRFSGMRYFPHIAKELVWIDYSLLFNQHRASADFGGEFTYSNVGFHEPLMQNGLNLTSDGNIFTVIHIGGPRADLGGAIDRNAQPVSQGEVPMIEQVRGSLQIALDYLDNLIEAGVDDNTLFIVLADHGLTQMNQRPLLLVRDPAHRTPFSISSAPLSFENLMPMLESYVMRELTAVEYLKNAAIGQYERMFYYYSEVDMAFGIATIAFLSDVREYVFSASSTDVANAQFSGVVHEGMGRLHLEPPVYRLNDTLHFASANPYFTTPFIYFPVGVSIPDDDYTWSYGHESLFAVRLDVPATSDLRLDMTFLVFPSSGGQNVRLYSGNQLVDEVNFPDVGWEFQTASFEIPKESVGNGLDLELRFEFPDAVRPMDVWANSEEVRLVAIGFREMTISAVD